MKRQVVIFGAFLLLTFAQRQLFAGTVMYDNIPAPTPVNLPSLGYQANQTAEFGDLIQFAPGTSRSPQHVTAFMSDWALASSYTTGGAGWSHPITLNLYNVDSRSGTPQPGLVITSVTQTFFIPWRPEADVTCPGGTAFRAGDGQCYNGLGFEVTFDLTNLNLTVPDQIIYGIAYNTNTWGYNPIGEPGPYESLNFGLNTVAPTVGSNPLPDTAYWNTMTAANYTDHGVVGTFRQDTGWSAYSGAVEFDSVPEPGTVGLMLGGGLLILTGAIRRKKQGKR
jgi:hypothetical protein